MDNWPSDSIRPGMRVRIKSAPDRVGTATDQLEGSERRRRVVVMFDGDGADAILFSSLEPVESRRLGDFERFEAGMFGSVGHLRKEITFRRLSGKLANLIYSLNTTNTQFLAYQFKPVLQFLDSPSNGILIADEVGLGKTIEAGLIWTELKARTEARRLLIVCPAMLREKWVDELANRFGVAAQIVDAGELVTKLESARARPFEEFALVASLQGLRPPRGFDEGKATNGAARLGRFLDDLEAENPLIDLVIVDEAHYLRNETSQTHKLGQLLRPVAESLVMLSATPIQLRNKDLFNLLKLIDEDAFPYEFSFEDALHSNAPIIELRDRVLAGLAFPEDFPQAFRESQKRTFFGESAQIEHLITHPPSVEDLKDPKSRSELADQLDRINPLSKVVTRTLKREVTENRVIRDPRALTAEMSVIEQDFYESVTSKVREYCSANELSTGFILSTPQRQMASSMAAACRGWQRKFDQHYRSDLEEMVNELDGDIDNEIEVPTAMGALVAELVEISQEVGSYDALKANDTKYAHLLKSLKEYWSQYPAGKIILFAFYKDTLYYLHERLSEDGFESVVLHGGMDKNEVIREFKSSDKQKILLSSEVAAEGVDLQFSSVVINYDLPWNPMRIEQRIGRIDRIGQEAERIHIWNMMYADTIDQRIYDRLLDRLDIFKIAMGSMETVLGEQVRELTKDLLGHKLTAEQERQRIEQTALALEKNKRDQERLEQEAVQLIAHGDFIQNKVRAARELGRFISGEDLFIYVRDYLVDKYPGSRLVQSEKDPDWYFCDLSTQARAEFNSFLSSNHLQGKTQILSHNASPLFFNNQQGRPLTGAERVTQDHPLIRFVTNGLKSSGNKASDYSVHAISLPRVESAGIDPGTYIYAVSRWSVSGALNTEKLAYAVKNLESGETLDSDQSELLVNTSALKGKDWLSAKNELDTVAAAELFEDAREELEKIFDQYRASMKRENTDRIRMMVATLQKELETKSDRIQDKIQTYRSSGEPQKLRMIKPEEGKLKKIRTKLNDRIAEIELRKDVDVSPSFIAGGVIKVS
jgi:superfamily II DNA or RNA helicase